MQTRNVRQVDTGLFQAVTMTTFVLQGVHMMYTSGAYSMSERCFKDYLYSHIGGTCTPGVIARFSTQENGWHDLRLAYTCVDTA